MRVSDVDHCCGSECVQVISNPIYQEAALVNTGAGKRRALPDADEPLDDLYAGMEETGDGFYAQPTGLGFVNPCVYDAPTTFNNIYQKPCPASGSGESTPVRFVRTLDTLN